MSKNGFLIISLDFELVWGVFDTVIVKEKQEYFYNTKQAIPEILKLFKQYDIHATWASVGMLFNNNWEEWKNNKPKNLPNYLNENLNSYSYGDSCMDYTDKNSFFAPELIKEISTFKGQEIGTHTYSHYYCLEEEQDIEAFKMDLSTSIKIAKKNDLEIKSLVFPRNQIKESYLEVCKEFGINNVRSNPRSWYWKDVCSESLLTRISRTADVYLPLGKKTYSLDDLKIDSSGVLAQMASRFLRPVESISILRKLKLARIKMEMSNAAKKGEIYHLWWHPHNFGNLPQKSLTDLKVLLDHFNMLKNKYNFQSLNMEELRLIVIKNTKLP